MVRLNQLIGPYTQSFSCRKKRPKILVSRTIAQGDPTLTSNILGLVHSVVVESLPYLSVVYK